MPLFICCCILDIVFPYSHFHTLETKVFLTLFLDDILSHYHFLKRFFHILPTRSLTKIIPDVQVQYMQTIRRKDKIRNEILASKRLSNLLWIFQKDDLLLKLTFDHINKAIFIFFNSYVTFSVVMLQTFG